MFGPYVFTSYSKVKDSAPHPLGYVNLNGWLNFTGDVVLEGDLNSSESCSDYSGSYVRYYQGAWVWHHTAKNNKLLSLPAIGTMMLYNDDTQALERGLQGEPVPLPRYISAT